MANAPPGAPALPILPPVDGLLLLDRAKFSAAFAADVTPEVARFMADSQQPSGAQAQEGKVTAPAWRVKPSCSLFANDDHIIAAPAQGMMAQHAGATVRDVAASHAVYVSQGRRGRIPFEEAVVKSAESAGRARPASLAVCEFGSKVLGSVGGYWRISRRFIPDVEPGGPPDTTSDGRSRP